MPLAERFLAYVEQQRNANSLKEAYGIYDPRTVDAYQIANETKREVLMGIRKLENEDES